MLPSSTRRPVIAGDGLDQAAQLFPFLTNLQLTGPTSLTYTTPPLQKAINAVGPASLDVSVSSTAPVTDLYTVVADVWPDGTAYPVATGELRTSYPNIVRPSSLVDSEGDVVDPYNDFSTQDPASPGTATWRSSRSGITLPPVTEFASTSSEHHSTNFRRPRGSTRSPWVA